MMEVKKLLPYVCMCVRRRDIKDETRLRLLNKKKRKARRTTSEKCHRFFFCGAIQALNSLLAEATA
jgi:hypothetical protein